jgi:urease accessory protein
MAADPATTGSSLSLLLAWLSPSFPVGSFSYSHGLEWAVEDGTVKDAAGLTAWIADVLSHGAGRTDAILIAEAYRAASEDDPARLADIAELALAFQPSRERHLESTAQGTAFIDAIRAAWPAPRLDALAAIAAPEGIVAYPVAFALAAAAHRIALTPALAAYLQAFAASLVSAGIRTVPLGQTDGQRVIAALLPGIEEHALAAIGASVEDLGGAALRADIASMKHETQYTRLFRS